MSFKSFVAAVRAYPGTAELRLSMSKLNDAISRACYDRPYAAVCAAEAAGHLSPLTLPPQFVAGAAERFQLDEDALYRVIVDASKSGANETTPNRAVIDFDWKGLSRVPNGSLVLVAATRPERRDEFFAQMLARCHGRYRIAFHCTREHDSDFRSRVETTVEKAMKQEAGFAALRESKAIAYMENPDPVGLRAPQEEAKAKEFHKQKEAYSAYLKACADEKAKTDAIVSRLTAENFARWKRDAKRWFTTKQSSRLCVDQLVTTGMNVVAIDDLSSVSLDSSKRPSSRQAGDVARELKYLAMEEGVVLVAGLIVAERNSRDRDRYTGGSFAAPINLQDFGPYGNPHEAADVVLEASGVDHPGLHFREICNRYPDKQQ